VRVVDRRKVADASLRRRCGWYGKVGDGCAVVKVHDACGVDGAWTGLVIPFTVKQRDDITDVVDIHDGTAVVYLGRHRAPAGSAAATPSHVPCGPIHGVGSPRSQCE